MYEFINGRYIYYEVPAVNRIKNYFGVSLAISVLNNIQIVATENILSTSDKFTQFAIFDNYGVTLGWRVGIVKRIPKAKQLWKGGVGENLSSPKKSQKCHFFCPLQSLYLTYSVTTPTNS